MKKTALIFCLMIIFLFGCGTDTGYSGLRSSSYRDKYDYYDANVELMMESMSLNAQQADSAFGVLAEAGVDSQISNIIRMNNGLGQTYYRIWWGEDYSTSVEVYAEDGTVVKVLSGEDVLYDAKGSEGKDIETSSADGETQQVNGENEDTTASNTEPADPSIQTDAPTESSGSIQVQSLTSPIERGRTAYMEILGTPGEEYSITVYYASSVSKAADLVPKVADDNGLVTWKWKVGSRTAAGTYKITVTGGGDTLETVFVVTE